jgi:hypothetical protein
MRFNTHDPSTTRFNHPPTLSTPNNASQPPCLVFQPLNTRFGYLRPTSHAFRPSLASQAPKCTYEQSYVLFFFCFFFWLRKRVYEQSYTRSLCFLFCISFFFTRDTCTSNRTRVSSVFFFPILFHLRCVYDYSYTRLLCFLYVLYSYSTLDACTSNRTRFLSYFYFYIIIYLQNA